MARDVGASFSSMGACERHCNSGAEEAARPGGKLALREILVRIAWAGGRMVGPYRRHRRSGCLCVHWVCLSGMRRSTHWDDRTPSSDIAAEEAIHAPPDGYMLLLVTSSHAINANSVRQPEVQYPCDLAPDRFDCQRAKCDGRHPRGYNRSSVHRLREGQSGEAQWRRVATGPRVIGRRAVQSVPFASFVFWQSRSTAGPFH
jgi:hypothetical protein